MDDQRPKHVDISLDVSAEENRFAATKVCKGAPCGFSEAKTSSNEVKERSASMWKLWAGIVLCVIFMTVEVVGGIKANSLAILTDAAHLLSDVAAFAISLFSVWAAGWEATPRQSYGFFRIEILGTLVSIQIIWLLTGILVYEAVERLINGTVDVEAKKKKRGNINVQGAYLHVLGDLIQSIGVMIGAAVIWYNPKLKVIDPICTLLFSLIVLYTTVNMLRDILEVLMESTPREIDATSLERGLCEIDEVVAIHELHIWAITVGKVLLACHVRIRREADADMTLDKVVDYIKREYNISHVTIQIERE
ncbi:Cation efflux protein [Artemisia annua]|uniref:Cation efflux protein n=1 Tax=Artemisia annua TaxID=35608 RepID=A0A2U1PS02_ARTAN|nr:Cation efflux protein [Artemisia annua]